ncbi:MAG TPA: GTP 3',8-cyclase MoaA [Gemmatimonadales bacterium]|nr:GTP 3',8-cyclase MoaA [Gemmatimonadales bacterium]
MTVPVDRLGRRLGALRLSVTDRCNLRCHYCMPEAEYAWLPRESILTFEELERVARVFVSLGVRKLRLTGGEPLLRRELPALVARLAAIAPGLDLALTTNGVLLADQAPALRAAGLGRLTVSLDTLRPERMLRDARSPRHADVLRGIAAARAAGFRGLKLNAVIVRGVNEDELDDLLAFARAHEAELRFIEYMDVGGATGWSLEQVVSRAEILARLAARHGPVEALPDAGDPAAPAERFRTCAGQVFGIVASTTAPFCRRCDRSRVTADGVWFTCLYGERGVDLRASLRAGADDAALAALVREVWTARTDRGAERRATAGERGALYQIAGLRADPHREMHTRGG